MIRLRFGLLMLLVIGWGSALIQAAEPLKLQLRSRTETAPKTGRYHTLIREEEWIRPRRL